MDDAQRHEWNETQESRTHRDQQLARLTDALTTIIAQAQLLQRRARADAERSRRSHAIERAVWQAAVALDELRHQPG